VYAQDDGSGSATDPVPACVDENSDGLDDVTGEHRRIRQHDRPVVRRA